MSDTPKRRPRGGQTFVCTSPACPEHEPPDPDCIECSKAFWGWALGDRPVKDGTP